MLSLSDPWGALLMMAGLTLVVAGLFRDFNFDDAYIVARYAQNVAAGQGWVFNPGERYNGATSALFTLLVAGLARLGIEPIAAAHLLGVAALAAAVGLTGWLVWLAGWPVGGAVTGALLAMSPLLHLTVGLETTLYLALLALALVLYQRGRLTWAGVVLGLLVLTRGDGAALVSVDVGHLALTGGLHERRGAGGSDGRAAGKLARWAGWRLVLAAGLVVVPWLVFSVATFGSPFPDTLSAKLAHVRSGLWQEQPGNLFLEWSAIWLRIFMGPPWAVYPVALLGLAALVRRRSRLLLGPAAVAVVFAAYAALGIVAYHWYLAPVVWATALLAGVGAEQGSRWLLERAPRAWLDAARWQRFVAVVVPAVLVLIAVGLSVPGLQVALVREARDPRDVAYSRAGAWLGAHAAPGASFAAVEAGTIAYRSGLRAIDPLGLVSPRLAAALGEGDNTGWLTQTDPDYIVVHDPPVLLESDLLRLPEFRARYEAVERFATPNYRYELAIYRRLPPAERRTAPGVEPVELPSWVFDTPAAWPWAPNAQLEPAVPASAGRFVATGGDPFFVSPPLNVPSRAVAGLEIRLRARTRSGNLAATGEIYYVRDGEAGFSPERRQTFTVRADGKPRTYRVALEAWDDPNATFSRLRFDPLPEPGEVEIESIRLIGVWEAAGMAGPVSPLPLGEGWGEGRCCPAEAALTPAVSQRERGKRPR